MATRQSNAVLFSGGASISLNSNSLVWSDEFIFNANDRENAALHLHADNSGTPASGDFVTCYIAWTGGDLTGGGGNQFDTDEHAERIAVLDTYATNTPGEDPTRRTVHIPAVAKGFKLGAKANQGGTRAVTFRALVSNVRD